MLQEMTSTVPRRLASVPLPLAGESLHSWVEHIAATYEIGRRHAMSLLGLEVENSAGRRLAYRTIQLTTAQAANVSAATGLTLDEVFAMTLSPLYVDDKGQRIPDLWINAGGRNSFRSTKVLGGVCPKCLHQKDNRWPLLWYRRWSVICLEHSCYLVRECTGCDAPIQPWRFRDRSPGLCTGPMPVSPSLRRPAAVERTGTLWCGKPLKELPVLRTRDRVLLEIQAWLNTLPLVDGPGQECDRAAENDFNVLLKLVSWHAEPRHLAGADKAVREGFPARTRSRKATNSFPGLGMAGMVRIAGQLAICEDMDEATRWLLGNEEVDSPRPHPDHPWDDNDIWLFLLGSQRLQSILKLSLGPISYDKLTWRRDL
ncbi:TniQ family protein [Kitasatospora sp. NPDC056731]|uniref:TniQ family protein n=1 Tax=Kitasatospora sp. NPDC056731 TaxID=3155422 RepID=UPI00342135B7